MYILYVETSLVLQKMIFIVILMKNNKFVMRIMG